jgi:ABC-2 type transport system permease protein
MRYALLVAWREFAESAKTKGFWLSLFMLPVMLFLSIHVPILLAKKATPTRYFVLVDQSGKYEPIVTAALERAYQRRVLEALKDYAHKYAASPSRGAEFGEDNSGSLEASFKKGGEAACLAFIRPQLKPNAPAFKTPRREYQRAALPPGLDANAELASLATSLKPYLRGDQTISVEGDQAGLYGAILIPPDLDRQIVRPHAASTGSGATGIQYWSTDVTPTKDGTGLPHEVEHAVNDDIRHREYVARGLDVAAMRQVEGTYAPFVSLNPKKEAGKEAIDTTDVIKQWAPSGFVYLLWVAIFVIIQMLLSNTIEEKSNRIIEVLLSSVTPGELMMGKLIGIAAVGLSMVAGWMLALFGILSWQSGGASEIAGQVLTVLKGSNLVPLFSLYFLLGYLMYAGFILSIGSICNTLKEAQSYMGVLTMVLMVPMLTMTFIPREPNGTLARVLSWIPIYTPFTMMNRAGADPPLVDLIGTFLLLVATTAIALWMSGKIFRIGILRTGQPPKVVEMLRWIKGG